MAHILLSTLLIILIGFSNIFIALFLVALAVIIYLTSKTNYQNMIQSIVDQANCNIQLALVSWQRLYKTSLLAALSGYLFSCIFLILHINNPSLMPTSFSIFLSIFILSCTLCSIICLPVKLELNKKIQASNTHRN